MGRGWRGHSASKPRPPWMLCQGHADGGGATDRPPINPVFAKQRAQVPPKPDPKLPSPMKPLKLPALYRRAAEQVAQAAEQVDLPPPPWPATALLAAKMPPAAPRLTPMLMIQRLTRAGRHQATRISAPDRAA